MAVEKITQPYEFLCRWENGKFKAYHFKTITTVKDGDEVLAVKESDAMTVQMAEESGFPIADILGALHTQALTAVTVAEEEKAVALAERDAAVLTRDAAVAQLDAIKAAHQKIAAVVIEVDAANRTPA